MAIGIQMAGPDLTPANVPERACGPTRAARPAPPNALYGTWAFPTGHYTPQIGLGLHLLGPQQDLALQRQDGRLRRLDHPLRRSARTRRRRCRCPRTSRSRRRAGLAGRGDRPSARSVGLRPRPRRRRPRAARACRVAARLILLFVVPALWPHAAPEGRSCYGAEYGAVNGLFALGLVLTYRASRVINFSYGAMGALAATVGVELQPGPPRQLVRLHRGGPRWSGPRLGLLRRPHHPLALLHRAPADRHGRHHRAGPALRRDPAAGARLAAAGPSIVGGVTTPLSQPHVLHLPGALQRQRPADRHRRPGGAGGAGLVPPAHRRRDRGALGGRQLPTGPACSASRSAAVHAGLGHRRPAGRPDAPF